MRGMFRVLGAAVACFTLWGEAYAHGVWFAPRSGQLAMIYGHGGEDLDMVKRYDKVRAVTGYNAEGIAVASGLRRTDYLTLVDLQKDPTVVAGVLDNGYWCKGADDTWVNQGGDEVPGAKECGRYVKFAVHVRKPLSVPLPTLAEHALQIIPQQKALPQQKGEMLTVQVLFQGKPVSGAKVIRDYVTDPDAPPLLTGADGTVTLQVRNQGLNVIAASYDAPPDNPVKATKSGLFATLSFVLVAAPE